MSYQDVRKEAALLVTWLPRIQLHYIMHIVVSTFSRRLYNLMVPCH